MKFNNNLKASISTSMIDGVDLRLSNMSISGFLISENNELIHLRTKYDSILMKQTEQSIKINSVTEREQ